MIFIRSIILLWFSLGVIKLIQCLIKIYFSKFIEVDAIVVDCHKKSKHYDRNHIMLIKVKYIVNGKSYKYEYSSRYIKSIDSKEKLMCNPKNPSECIRKYEYLDWLLYIFVFSILLVIVFCT